MERSRTTLIKIKVKFKFNVNLVKYVRRVTFVRLGRGNVNRLTKKRFKKVFYGFTLNFKKVKTVNGFGGKNG